MYIHPIIFNVLQRIYNSILIVILIITPLISAEAQRLELKIYSKDSINQQILNSLTPNKNYNNKSEIYKSIDSISNVLSIKGYINNTFLLNENDTITTCYFTLNKKIEFIRVFYNNEQLDKKFIKSISTNYTDAYFEVHTSQISKTLNIITNYYESQGFSFSKVSLKNLWINKSIIECELSLEVSAKRKINSIIIKGYDDFPKKYTKNYLNINSKSIFNTKSLNKIQKEVSSIPFITQIKNPEVLFTKDSTTLFIYIKKKSTSSFDGIIGISNEQKNNKIKLNGYLNLILNNVFNNGEEFGLNWKNNGDGINTLKLNLAIPYILRSKINADANFAISKYDTLYTNTNNQIKLNYNFNRSQAIGSVLNFENSNILNSQESTGISAFNKKLIGLSYSFINAKNKKVNDLKLELQHLRGIRKSENTKENQQQTYFHIKYLIYINKKSNLLLKNTSEIISSSNLFENELFRIGGINSIKGFDELSIPTSKHIITNVEYQLYTNNTNYLYTITDFAFIENQFLATKNKLIGFGLGYSLKSNNSIINIGYAVGKFNNQSFQLKKAKLHLKISYIF